MGSAAVALISRQPDPAIKKIIESWPQAFDPARALALGFVGETTFDDIIQVYLEDEM